MSVGRLATCVSRSVVASSRTERRTSATSANRDAIGASGPRWCGSGRQPGTSPVSPKATAPSLTAARRTVSSLHAVPARIPVARMNRISAMRTWPQAYAMKAAARHSAIGSTTRNGQRDMKGP